VAESTEASARLAEREGLVGKLCLPYVLRGLLRWREGDLGEAERLFGEAHELAERVGWSELAFQALYGLALALRDRGELSAAAQVLDRAVDLCERAGLLAQSIQAGAARAIVLALSGRREAARESATEAAELAERLHYPLARAAALEARGATAEDPEEGARLLGDAESAWAALSRPLEAARCRVLAGRVLLARDPERARRLIEDGAETAVRLGVPHLAEAVGPALAEPKPTPQA
jgi:tetratricopeptide (TPR) repeat protein